MTARTRTRDSLGSLGPLALMLAIVTAVMLLYTRYAHAAGTDPVAITASVDWMGVAVVIGLVLGGLGVILGGLSTVLHAIAPRTKTMLDDRAAAGVDALRAEVATLSGLLRGLIEQPAGGAVVGIARGGIAAQAGVVLPRDPQAGKARLATMTALALITAAVSGAAIIGVGGGCSKAQLNAEAVIVEHALINCTAQDLGTTPALDVPTLVAVVNIAVAEKARCSTSGSLDWTCVEHDAEAKGAQLGGCALLELLASAAPTGPSATARIADEPPDPGMAALAKLRAALPGHPVFHTAGGDR